MKVLKWLLIGVAGLAAVGALLGDDAKDKGTGTSSAAQAAGTPEADAEAASEATPEPTPKPTIQVNFMGPRVVHQDRVTLRGTVSDAKAKVRVKGASAVRKKGRRWAADVGIRTTGRNSYRIVATMRGAKTGRTAAIVVRKQSAAERAAAAEAARNEFITSAGGIDYDQLSKNPRRYKGDRVAMRGQIFQIGEEGSYTWMLLSVTDEGYGFWDDNVYVEYDGRIHGAEDDVITVYGTVKGEFSYERQIGGETYVPHVQAEYIDE